MVDDFDAYHKWLGIPPEEQPPNHYRLLGVRLLESDTDVISNAADQRMAHLRTFQTGKHASQSQKVLNEIAVARVCLLNPAKKHEYDQTLQQKLGPPTAPSPRPATPIRVAAPVRAPVSRVVAPEPESFVVPDEPVRSRARSRRRQTSSLAGPAILLVLLAGVGAGGFIYWKKQADSDAAPKTTARKQAKKNTDEVASSDKEPTGDAEPETAEPVKDEKQKRIIRKGQPTKRQEDPVAATKSLLAHVGRSVAMGNVVESEQAGGGGGETFEDVPQDGALLVGFRARGGSFSGHPVIAALQPIFLMSAGMQPGESRGNVGKSPTAEVAKPGYAVGAINIRSGHRVDGFEIVFMRIKRNGLDPSDTYTSPWIGGKGGGAPTTLGGDGTAVVGIFGGHRNELERLGLVMDAAGELESTGSTAAVPTDDAEPEMPLRTTMPEPGTPKERLPVPASADLKAALALIKDLFKKDFAEAKSPTQRHSLALTLFTKAKETTDDPVARYVLMDEAREIEAQVGNSEAVIEAIYTIASEYAIDDIGLTVSSLIESEKAPTDPILKKKLAENCLMLIEKAVERERFDVGERLVAVGQRAAKKAGDGLLADQLTARSTSLKVQSAAYAGVQKAIKTLVTSPDDPDANLVVGKYRCLLLQNWKDGLPALAKGSHRGLKQVAELELDSANDSAAQAKIADAWLALAKPDEPQKTQYQRRARYWYEQALPGSSGLARAKIEKSLESVSGGHGLRGEYFNGSNFEQKAKTRIDANVYFDWGRLLPDPEIRSELFSVRWTGWISAPVKGTYDLVLHHDDGARLIIEGKTLVDALDRGGRQTVTVNLSRKAQKIVIEYRNIASFATMRLSWSQKNGFSDQPVPPEALFHTLAAAQKGFGKGE